MAGNRLKELRISKKLRQKDIAEMLNVAVSTYSYWENGKYEIDFENLFVLSKFYSVSIDYILGIEGNQLETIAILYNKLNDEDKKKVKSYVEWLIDKDK